MIIEKQAGIASGTKEDIVGTARKLFSESTYLGVSMDDIAKELGFSKAALYYHFKSKDEIYEAVLKAVFHDFSNCLKESLAEKTGEKKLQKIVENYLTFGFREKNLVKALTMKLSADNYDTAISVEKFMRQSAYMIRSIIEYMHPDGKVFKKINSHLAADLVIGMMNGLILKHSFLDKKIDSKRVSMAIANILFKE